MTYSEDIMILQSGSENWNQYRNKYNQQKLNLRNFNFYDCHDNDKMDYGTPYLEGLDFTNSDLHMVSMRDGMYIKCNFDNSSMHWSDLCFGYFESCTFRNVELNVSKVGSAEFHNCIFDGAQLDYVTAEDTKFINCSFRNSSFRKAEFIGTNFSDSVLSDCDIYGISSWDLNLNNTKMNNLSIAKELEDTITVDDIELGQFIYLMLSNEKLRNVIDTITSKVVLILGRFSHDRKKILDEIKMELRKLGFVPVLFDFDCPESRNVSETVLTISGMSKFIIADLTDPRSIPQELQLILPNMTSVKVQPIIHESQKPYGMFYDHKNRPSLLPLIKYRDQDIHNIVNKIAICMTK